MTIKIFQCGKEFDQIYFLDNFYQEINIQDETATDLTKLLSTAIEYCNNNYVKRTAFKILCELTLIAKIHNKFTTLSHLHDFLSNSDSSLQVVALKYMPHFPEALTAISEENLKVLSDNEDGEVASQAFLCLGLLKLTYCILDVDSAKLLVNLSKAKSYFQAANQAVENRVDAQFYILFIEWIQSMLTDDVQAITKVFEKIEKNLQARSFYEFEEKGLELEFLIFQFIRQLKSCFEIASTSQEWLEIQQQVEALFNIHKETEKIRNIHSFNKALSDQIFEATFKNIEVHTYKVHLVTEKKRLFSLKTYAVDSQLKQFIEYLLTVFPDRPENGNDNLPLLAMLSENLGEKSALIVYQQVMNKEVSIEKAIGDLLKKSKGNQLPILTGSILGQEVLFSIMSNIDQKLPDYPLEKRVKHFSTL